MADDPPAPLDPRLLTRVAGDPTELPHLRAAVSEWLGGVGVDEELARDLVLATHELAAEAIERRAAEVAVLGELVGDAIRLSVAGGDWSSLDELRSKLVHGLIGDIRIHRGIVTIRLKTVGASRDEDTRRAGREQHSAMPHPLGRDEGGIAREQA